jgi:MFS family permease
LAKKRKQLKRNVALLGFLRIIQRSGKNLPRSRGIWSMRWDWDLPPTENVSVASISEGRFSVSSCKSGNSVSPLKILLMLVTGVNFVFYFGTMFFKSAGMKDPFLVAMIMGTVNCLCTFPGMYLVERIGRRKLLLYGALVQFISQGLVGIIHVATNGQAAVCTAVFTGTFIAAFAASWGPCAWVITSELFSLKTRAKQMSFAAAGNWYTWHVGALLIVGGSIHCLDKSRPCSLVLLRNRFWVSKWHSFG